jgi:hypothetical protein
VRQEAFHTSSTLEPQPSTWTAQIEPEQQEQMEIDDMDPNLFSPYAVSRLITSE